MRQDPHDRHGHRLEEALDSAEALFSEKGFHAASMRDIAHAAKFSVAGLYYYLPSKQDALYLVCNRIFDRLIAATHESPSIDDPNSGLRTFVREHLRYMIQHRRAYRVLLRDMEALQGEFREKLHTRRRRYFSRVSDVVNRLKGKDRLVSARLATAVLFGMLNWAPTWYQRELDGGVDELSDKMLALFLRGISVSTSAFQEVG